MTKIYSLLRIHVSYKTDIRYSLPIKSSKFSAIYTITAFFSVKTHNFAIIQQEISFLLSFGHALKDLTLEAIFKLNFVILHFIGAGLALYR